jgi:CheY-like chemotaxis protein
MDIQMPRMSSYESTAEIRRREEEGSPDRRTPIIAMTANALQGDREEALRAGMDDYIAKPVRIEELEAILERWVAGSRAEPAPEGDEEGSIEAERTLDREVLAGLRGLEETSPGLLNELVELFIEETSPRIQALGVAVEAGDARSVERIAHSLKGSSGNMGGWRVSEVSSRLENAGASADLEQASKLLASLQEEFARMREALQAELEEPTSGNGSGQPR